MGVHSMGRRNTDPQSPIGCGSGVYLRYAAMINPSLTAIGVELQPSVAEVARTNLRRWGLEGRVKVEDGDFRAKAFDPELLRPF